MIRRPPLSSKPLFATLPTCSKRTFSSQPFITACIVLRMACASGRLLTICWRIRRSKIANSKAIPRSTPTSPPSARLLHIKYAVRRDMFETLHRPRRPVNLDRFHNRIWPQAEVHWSVARRSVTHASGHVVVLRPVFCNHFHPGSNAVAIAARAFQRDIKPVTGIRTPVQPYLSILAQSGCDHINAPVTIEIAKRNPAMARRGKCVEAGLLRKRQPLPHSTRIGGTGIRNTSASKTRIAEPSVVLLNLLVLRCSGVDVAARDK